jgi:hypothetical protein
MEVSPTAKELARFAREELERGRGEWWIVSEMEKRWRIDETNARAIVATVSPWVYRSFLRRRRAFLVGGALLILMGANLIYFLGWDLSLLASMLAFPGLALVAFGWPGLRRLPRGDSPTSIPGRMDPVGPRFRRDPFN